MVSVLHFWKFLSYKRLRLKISAKCGHYLEYLEIIQYHIFSKYLCMAGNAKVGYMKDMFLLYHGLKLYWGQIFILYTISAEIREIR